MKTAEVAGRGCGQWLLKRGDVGAVGGVKDGDGAICIKVFSDAAGRRY